MMYRKILCLLLMVAMLIVPVSAWTVTERSTFQPAKYQGYLFNNQTVTFDGMTEICAYYGLGPYAVGTTGTGFGYALAPTTYHDLLGANVTYSPLVRPFISPGALHGVHWDNGDTVNIGTEPTALSPKWVGQFSFCADGNFGTGKWWITAGEAPNSTIFSISDSADFATKLSGVSINVSNGQSATTDALGTATILIYPPLGTYTYSLTKTGYTGKFLQPLGGYGMTGGTVYNTLVAGNATLPAGYTRTTVYATDGDSGNTIVGATLNIKDVQNASWINATSTATGTIIDVIAGHTLDIYGDYPGVYNASLELGATPGGPYYLPMFMYRSAPVGYVYLYVTARDAATGIAILNAPISGRWDIAVTTDVNSGSSGTASFLVPNNSVIVVSASPSGYNPISISTTVTTVNKHVFIDLSRSIVPTSTVAPVVTDPATGAVIPQTTYLDGCNPNSKDYSATKCAQSQDSDLMATLRIWAPSLLMLMILAWCFGLLKMIMKW